MSTEHTAPDATAAVAAGNALTGTLPTGGLLSLPGTLSTLGDPDAGACVDGFCAVPTSDAEGTD